jgi:hypothetical protein
VYKEGSGRRLAKASSKETLQVLIKRNGVGSCGFSLSCLHESVEEVGRDTSPYDAFSPALVDCFFVAIFF